VGDFIQESWAASSRYARATSSESAAYQPLTGLAVLFGYLAAVLVFAHFTYTYVEHPYREKSRELTARLFRHLQPVTAIATQA
jgi:peptidoglycan/LPS O-acetylase OafA/YrhL